MAGSNILLFYDDNFRNVRPVLWSRYDFIYTFQLQRKNNQNLLSSANADEILFGIRISKENLTKSEESFLSNLHQQILLLASFYLNMPLCSKLPQQEERN